MLADLSVNHVERVALHCGYLVYRLWPDYGLDLAVFTFDEGGLCEEGVVWMQVKATDRLKLSSDGKAALVRVERRDILAWLRQLHPVILVLYDGARDVAYHLSIQDYFGGRGIFAKLSGQVVTVPVPTENLLSEAAMRGFARAKRAMARTKRRPS